MPWKKGQSGNPKGRPGLPAAVRGVMKESGEIAAQRINQMVKNDMLFDREEIDPDTGELRTVEGLWDSKAQLTVLSLAIDRAYGKAATAVDVQHEHKGTITMDAVTNRLKDITERLPERVGQQRAVDMIEATVEEVEPSLPRPSDDV